MFTILSRRSLCVFSSPKATHSYTLYFFLVCPLIDLKMFRITLLNCLGIQWYVCGDGSSTKKNYYVKNIANILIFPHLGIYIFILTVHNLIGDGRINMVQIKVTPEELEQVAKRANDTKHMLESIHKNLCDQIDYMCYQWAGASNQNFVQVFNNARPSVFTATNAISHIEEELKRIAEKFRNTDNQDVAKAEGAMCGKVSMEEKGFDEKKLARDIAGELTGEYDIRRAWDGIDPSTGEKLSTWDRIFAGGMAVAGLTPFGKLAKVGKGVKMTTNALEGIKNADKAAEASKATKRITQAEEEMVTYRRVQGGTPPNASRTRITVDENSNVEIPNKKANLNVSTGNDEHAKYFLNKRGSNAEIVEFDIPKSLDDFINENAIPQKGYKSNPLNQGGTAPKIVDPTTPGNSYELPAPWIEWIEEYAKNGRIIK